MSNFPNNFDDDTTLPVVNDNLTEIGGDAINALRDAVFNIEMNIGLDAAGTTPSIAARLGLLINPDGSPNSSTITSLGLVTLPITQDQIIDNAQIPESKLRLDYRTQDLFNYIRDLSRDVNTALGWISVSGVKLEPHLIGAIYRHDLTQIDVAENPAQFLNNVFRVQRDNTSAYSLINDMNNELLAHQWADGSPFGIIKNITTNDGSVYPSNYAHVASGIFVNTSRFQTIPQTDEDVQSALEFIDSSTTLLIGSRIQNLYANGISNNSRSSVLTTDGYGQSIIPVTPATAYLLAPDGLATTPVDSINIGDDIIQFNPSAADMANNTFDEKFASVRVGDIIRVNYGGIEVAWVISEIKYNQSGPNKTYLVRIAGKNIAFAPNAVARIDRSLFNNNKYGVLATAITNNTASGPSVPSSLIVGAPRGAQVLGIGFNPDQFDSAHYILYLALYPTGNPSDGYTILPGIDVTGNQGSTPGLYTLDSIVNTTNLAFRRPGYNYRFIAFERGGEFGIMLADSYNNASFSIINMIVADNGFVDPINTTLNFPNNVIGGLVSAGIDGYNLPDPLGFGLLRANLASPPLMTSYGSAAASQFPTKLFVPLSKNNYYVNGSERERLNLQVGQALDQFGDGYWVATIDGYTVIPGTPGHVATTYRVPLFLSTSDLKIGKTIVVQSLGAGGLVDFGRFVISGITFDDGPPVTTLITVYDAVHAAGTSPVATLATGGGVGSKVAIYFNSDSVAFDQESATDFITPPGSVFRRRFEVYVNENGNTYTHERGRLNTSGATITVNSVPLYSSSPLSFVNLVDISPKLRGYDFSTVTKINLQIFSYDVATGLYDGYLCRYDGTSATNVGPVTFGQKGKVTRFYDETNIDFIDIIFASTDPVPQIVTTQIIDIQLFPTLSLDQDIMLLSTCQFNDFTALVNYLTDARQFGNISEQQLTTSAIDFINANDRALHENGIIRGFDCPLYGLTVADGSLSFTGGEAFIDGELIQVNPQTVNIPAVLEALPIVPGGSPTITSTVNVITWFVCVNDKAEIELIASTDFSPFGPFVVQYEAASLNHLRLFYGMNPNAFAPTPYQLRGTYFGDLVINQKDVTPIAVVSATVTNPGSGFVVTSMTVKDAKRFVANGYGGLSDPLTVGANASFKSFLSILTWLDQLNNYFSASFGGNPISNTVIIKGHIPVIIPIQLTYAFGEVYFVGDAGVFDVYIATGFELGSNIHFDKITFNYLYDPVVYDSVYGDVTSGRYNPTNPGSNAPADLINASRTNSAFGKGLIHIGMGAAPFQVFADNISITNCFFNWIPLVAGDDGFPPFVPVAPISSTAVNRFSFILVEYGQAAPGAPSVILQNIDISNNVFTDSIGSTFILANYDTVRSVIAFVCLSTIASESKLINAFIRNNVCNKDQLIAIVPTSSTDGYTTINSAIDTTNCIIEANTCGAISIFTQYTYPLDVNYTSNYFNFMLDKNNGLIVSKNVCKYITSTDARGIDLYVTSGPANSLLVNTGPMTISDNTVSWIKLPLNVVIPGATPCIIKNNKLNAYDINFRKNYLNNFNTFLTNAAIELITIGSSFGVNSALIDGNWISDGFYITFVPPITNPTYDIGIFSQHDADICNNLIIGLAPVLNPLVNPTGIVLNGSVALPLFSTNIHHNKLYRETKIWTAYIDLGMNGVHQVANNTFDSITPDNVFFHAAQQIIATGGTPNSSSIHDNVNQAIFEAISFADEKLGFTTAATYLGQTIARVAPFPGSLPFVAPGIFYIDDLNGVSIHKFSDVFSQTSEYIGIFETGNFTANVRNMSFTIPITSRVPNGVKIVGISVGIWIAHSGASQFDTTSNANNNFSLSLTSTRSNVSSGIGNVPVTDVKNNLSPFFNPLSPITSTNNPTAISDFSLANAQSATLILGTGVGTPPFTIVSAATAAANTQFINAIAPGGFLYTTGNGYRISAQLDMCWLRTGGSAITDSIQIYISPVLVTYQW